MKVNSLLTNKYTLNSLKFAAENSSLFSATASLALSTIARPISIMLTPDTNKENKKIACAKSLSSSATGYLIMAGASIPIAKAIKNIDNNPAKYLKQQTIQNLQGSAKSLTKSSKYSFATQLFKLGLGFVIAAPKSALTCALIPLIMSGISRKNQQEKDSTNNKQNQQQSIAFGNLYTNMTRTINSNSNYINKIYNHGVELLSKGIGKIIDTKTVQNISEKYSNTNFPQHIMSATDVLTTLTFIKQTQKNKKIEEERKKPLIYNSLISTGLCITGGYAINSVLEKPTEKLIQNFKNANKTLPDLEKYIEGIKIAKPALILGSIYYIAIPLLATFFADRIDNSNNVKNI